MWIQRKTKYNGVALLEVMFVLAVVSILLLTAARYLNTTRSTHKAGQALTAIFEVSRASDLWLSLFKSFNTGPDGDPISIERLINSNMLSVNFADYANPWYGDTKVVPAPLNVPGSPSDKALLTMTQVPLNACNYIKNTVKAQYAHSGGMVDCNGDSEVEYVTLTVILPIGRSEGGEN